MSEKCFKCFRPVKTCYCSSISSFNPGVKFVFLMHPWEAYKQKTGTGRLASLTLEGSEIIIGKSFHDNTRVNELIGDENYSPYVLYPGKEPHYSDSPQLKEAAHSKTLLIFLIDATWVMAKKMMYKSPNLKAIPCLSFQRAYRSRFFIKKQPMEHCLSTIESVFYLIEELKEGGICDKQLDPSPLITVFDKMVAYQQECKKDKLLEHSL